MPRRKTVGGARAGAGRKPIGAAARTAYIPVKATEAQRASFRSAAEAEERSLSDWMVAAGELAIARGSTR